MKILVVDDQRAIVESISRGIHWEKLGIDEVFTACSSAEAKLILVNFSIDIMLCDIEMPGEDGLSLLKWTKEQKMEVCCIFLTAHADFQYAKKAIELGGFDYVLQPVKYTEIEEVLKRAVSQVDRARQIEWLRETQKNLLKRRDIFLTALVSKVRQKEYPEAEKVFEQLVSLLGLKRENLVAYTAVCIQREKRFGPDNWEMDLKVFAMRNVLEELLENQVKVCVSGEKEKRYQILVLTSRERLDDRKWRGVLEQFWKFMDSQMAVTVSIYTGEGMQDFRDGLPRGILASFGMEENHPELPVSGIVWKTTEEEPAKDENDVRIRKVIEYIRVHVHQNVTRAEAANLIYLNEEYFSKVFKAHTGMTFKDYVLKEKMKTAMKLLVNTNLSVGLVASKVGFDNFSHFSKTFKRFTNLSPQEYRKKNQK